MPRKKVVVITGASAGVGRATAIAFAAQGARIGLVARGRDGLKGAVRDVTERGGEALALLADVADPRQVEDTAEKVERKFGLIDVWVNNAMVSVFSPALEMKAEEYQRVTEVTYLGVVYGTLAALRRMKERDRGVIVQVGSALAYRSIPLQSAYCGAKHAIAGFTDSLRCELIHDHSNVHLTMVQMPALNTPQFSWVKSRLPHKPQPVPPIFQPEVAARAILYAAQHHPRELWVGGPTIKAIVGNMLAPGFADSYLGGTGYDSQQTNAPVAPGRKDNLWQPLRGDHGAHGEFDDRAHNHSWELEARIHWPWIVGAGLGLVTALLSASRRKEETLNHRGYEEKLIEGTKDIANENQNRDSSENALQRHG
ncbi:MAG TPA: SDR family oxidoreductase [Terriglobales bacterium]|nr:SDR family oxidoreductase [Terriglobales bacterium]